MKIQTQKYDRFKSAPWFQENKKPPVLIGGAGGIGSWLAMLLNRAGFETYVYDFDTLEEVNMAGQLFMHKSIGKTKVDALADVIRELCQEEIIPNLAKVDENTMTNDIVFSAFDNMKARQDLFTSWVNVNRGNPAAIFIDGRLTAEQITIFCIKGDNYQEVEKYQANHLFPDGDVADLDCTMKQTSHGAAMIASHMVEFFTNWYSGVLNRDTSRVAPYFWEHMLPIDYTNSYNAEDEDLSEEDVEEKSEEVAEVNSTVIEPMPDITYVQGVDPYRKEIPEGHVLLDTGEIVPITDGAAIQESSSVMVTHNLTPEQVQERYGQDVPGVGGETFNLTLNQDMFTSNVLQDRAIDDLGTTEETELLPQELRTVFDELDRVFPEPIEESPEDIEHLEDGDDHSEAQPDSPTNPSPADLSGDLPF